MKHTKSMRRLLLISLLLATTASAELVPIPADAPPVIPPPEMGPHTMNPWAFMVTVKLFVEHILDIDYKCLVFYAYREHADPYESHLWSLQRHRDDGHGWITIGCTTAPLSPDGARPLFADRIDRDETDNYIGVTHYRVVDEGIAP